MTHAPNRLEPPTRPAGRRTVAAVLAFVLGVTSLTVGVGSGAVSAAGAQVAPAEISVSKTTNIDPAGETLTITGTGFDPAGHVGTRPPLAGQPSGVYVTFGRFASVWKPSESAPSASREIIIQRWAVPAAQRAQLDPTGTNPEIALLNPDGSFSVQLPVAPGGTTAGEYAIAVYPGSGAKNAAQERIEPISFATGPVWQPEVEVSTTTGIDDAGESVTVTGSGFDPAANIGTRPPLSGQPSGIYAVFGRFGDPWEPSEAAPTSAREVLAQTWLLPAAQRAALDPSGTNPAFGTLNPDGTFSVDLPVAPGGTSAGQYAIATYAGGGAVNADHEILTPISFASDPVVWEPTVSVSKTDGLAEAGETITVTGSGFDPAANAGAHPPIIGQPSGVYVAFGRYAEEWKPSDGADAATREGLSVVWVLPASTRALLDPSGTVPGFATLAEDGTFSVDLEAAPGGTTTGDYAVVTYAGGGAINADQELRTPITFATTPPPATPGTGTGPLGQTLTVTPYADLDPEGQDLLVEGTGYDPEVGVYAAVCVDQGPNLPPSPCLGGSGEQSATSSSAWITNEEMFASLRTAPFGPGGSFSVTVNVTAADELMDCYDPATTCVLATRADHTATTDRSADVKIPIFFEGQTPVAPEPPAVPDTTATIDRTSVVAGGEITVSGQGFLPGEQVQVWLHSDPELLAVVVADSLGKVNTAVTIPTTTPAGTHHLELTGVASALRLVSPTFTVIAAAVTPATTAATPATTTTGTLPVTGAASLALIVTGLALLVLGLVLAGPARHRHALTPSGGSSVPMFTTRPTQEPRS